MSKFATKQELIWRTSVATGVPEAPSDGTTYGRKNAAWAAVVAGGDALTANNLDQFASVTQTAGKTLAITDNTTLNGGTINGGIHSGTNTGDSASESAGSIATHAALTTTHGISAFGASLVDDADAATARATLGLGSAATTASTAYEAAGAIATHAALPDVHHARAHTLTSTSDHSGGNWKTVYTNGSGTVVELALGAAGTALTGNGVSSAPTFTNPYGHGIVVVSGVPSGGSDQTVLDAAITAAGANGTVYLPKGTWRTAGGLTVNRAFNTESLRIVGAGRFQTFLRLDASADGQSAITVDNSGESSRFQIEDLTITTGTSDHNKCGLKILDGAETRIHNVNITGFNDTGTDSVGLWTLGRESLWCSDMEIGAIIPIRIGKNTRVDANGYISFDHFTFNNMVLTSANAPADLLHKACVLVDSGVQGLNLQFTGSQAWIMNGGDGFYWDNSAATNHTAYSGNLSLNNIRSENGDTTGPTKWSVYITEHASAQGIRNVSLNNCNLNATCEGYYLRNVAHISVRDTNLSQLSGRTICDVDGFRVMTWDNVWTNTTATTVGSVNVNGAIQQWLIPIETGYTYPNHSVWGEGAAYGASFEAAGAIATHAALPDVHHARGHSMTGTSDHSASNWRTFYSNGSGQVAEVALGAAGKVLTCNGVSSAPTFEYPYLLPTFSGADPGSPATGQIWLRTDL